MKYVLILTNKSTGERQVYATLNRLLDEHMIAPIHTINNYISRKKISYENDQWLIEKKEVLRGDILTK